MEKHTTRDRSALWVSCPECKAEFTVPASRVFWFVQYLLTRSGQSPRVPREERPKTNEA